MGQKSNKQNKARLKQRKFRDAKKKMQLVKLQEATRIPKNQHQRWAAGFSPLAPDLAETERDPDYVAFCVVKQLEDWEELSFLWLRIAAALRLGRYTVKAVDRTNRLRLFDKETFTKSIADDDYENEYGLRYEADKFLCYLLYGQHSRFRDLFGYVLLPSIKNDLAEELNIIVYNQWFAKEPTADLARRLVELNMAEVE